MSLSQSMFVIGVVFDNGFIIQNLYELLPIVPINNFDFTKGKTIPFFGINNAIVSVVPSIDNKGIIYEPRGVRNNRNIGESCSSFGNSITVDFQSHDKNFCIKITSSKKNKSKFHITGLKSYEMAKEVTFNLINQIKLTEKAWIAFFKLNFQQRFHFVSWVIDNIKFLLSISSDVREKMKLSLGDLYTCLELILRYTLEDKYIDNFKDRLYRIVNLSTGQFSVFHHQNDFKIILMDIYNGVYNGRICNNVIFLPFIANKLLEMGFQCSFFNVKKTEIRIMIPIINENHYSDDNKNTNIKGHLFRIGPEGSIELYSRGDPLEATSIGMWVINCITTIIYSDEYKKEILYKEVDTTKYITSQEIKNPTDNKITTLLNDEFKFEANNISLCANEYV